MEKLTNKQIIRRLKERIVRLKEKQIVADCNWSNLTERLKLLKRNLETEWPPTPFRNHTWEEFLDRVEQIIKHLHGEADQSDTNMRRVEQTLHELRTSIDDLTHPVIRSYLARQVQDDKEIYELGFELRNALKTNKILHKKILQKKNLVDSPAKSE